MEKHNPNIPYPVHPHYISVFKCSGRSDFFTQDEYLKVSSVIDKMSFGMRQIMDKLTAYDALPPMERRKATHPVEALGGKARQDYLDELNRIGVADFSDMKSVYADRLKGSRGFHTPVYMVNDHPVMGLHFDEKGNLKGPQSAVYAPSKPTAKPQPPKR